MLQPLTDVGHLPREVALVTGHDGVLSVAVQPLRQVEYVSQPVVNASGRLPQMGLERTAAPLADCVLDLLPVLECPPHPFPHLWRA